VACPAAHLAVRRSAALGDRARRAHAAGQRVARFLPWAAAAACGASALTLLVGRARPLGLVLLAASAGGAALVLIVARFNRPVSDDTVAELDTAAGLDGALHSAHWFASHDRTGAGSSADAAWVTFHVEATAGRAAGVDWRALYTRPPARRRWLATAVLSAATVAIFTVDSPLSQPVASATDAGGDTLIVIPHHLAGDVVEGMNAMKEGHPPTKQALKAVGQAIEIARKDPRARRELDDLFAQLGSADGRFLDTGVGDHDWDVNEMPYWDDGTPRLEWAYEAAVARAAVQESDTATADAAETSAREAGEGRAGALDRGVRGSMKPDGPPLLAATRGQPGSFSSLLFGRQAAHDDAAATAPRATGAPNAALAAALRREVVHARTDVGVANRVAATRRPPEATRARGGGPGVAATGLQHDSSSAGRPPAVPDARRVLVHDSFMRPAESAPAPAQP
jgi:hypothetical protein